MCVTCVQPPSKTKVGMGFHGAVSVRFVLTIGYSLIYVTCAVAHRCSEFKSSALPLSFRPCSLSAPSFVMSTEPWCNGVRVRGVPFDINKYSFSILYPHTTKVGSRYTPYPLGAYFSNGMKQFMRNPGITAPVKWFQRDS